MSYVDPAHLRMVAALDPQPETEDRWAGWIAVAKVAAVCALALLLFVGPSDVRIAGASDQTFDEWYAQPENARWYEFQQWYGASPRNASYFHVREAFGNGPTGDRAVRIAICESDLNPRAVSPTGDHGVMQLNARSWARRFEQVTGVAWNPNVYHASHNARFARWLHDETGGFSHWVCRG